MKTPMQELIETFKEVQKDQDPFSVHEAIELAESMLPKEEDYRQRMREIVAQELHNSGMPDDRIKEVIKNL